MRLIISLLFVLMVSSCNDTLFDAKMKAVCHENAGLYSYKWSGSVTNYEIKCNDGLVLLKTTGEIDALNGELVAKYLKEGL